MIPTDDEVDESKNRAEGFFLRKGYLGVYAIKDFTLDDADMHLVFTSWRSNSVLLYRRQPC